MSEHSYISFRYPNFFFSQRELFLNSDYNISVAHVLNDVVSCYEKYFINVHRHTLIVINEPSREGPLTEYESYTIYLAVNDLMANGGCRYDWSKYIYQFSHEFCHYMNFGHVIKSLRWFEESICEMASFFFLYEMSSLYSNRQQEEWNIFAPFLIDYAKLSMQKAEAFDLFALSDPSSDISTYLSIQEYDRKKNAFVAINLLQLFKENTELWKVIPHLPCVTALSFPQALNELQNLANMDLTSIASLFGISLDK